MLEVTTQGILLGFSTGLSCLSYCGPVYVPFMMSEKRRTVQSVQVLGELALGRLAAYLMFGAAAGYIGMRLEGLIFQRVMACATVALSILLIFYITGKGWSHPSLCRLANKNYVRFPAAFGFLTGLNLCPPFLLAISYTFGLGSMGEGILLFGGFFAGSSVFLLLLLPLGYLGRWQNVRHVAMMTGLLSATFFMFIGITRLAALAA